MEHMPIHALTLADEEFKSAFVEGKFVLDCLAITLTQNGAEIPATYSSPGYFFIGPENGAESRLVCLRANDEPIDPFASLKRSLELSSGRIIPDSHYFKVEARDVHGNVWTNPAASVQIEEREYSFTLTVACDYLRCELAGASKGAWTDIVLLEELEFPMNLLNQTQRLVRGKSSPLTFEFGSGGEAAGLTVIYDARKGKSGAAKFSELYAEPKDPAVEPPMNFDQRLLESVRFVTATMFWPVMIETVKDGIRTLELSKARVAPRGEMIHPPLIPRGYDQDFYNLLGSYYRYACANAAGDDIAPLSAKLGGLYSLKNVWVDTVALLVSVAVEAMLGEHVFKPIGKAEQKVIDQVDKIFDAIRAAAADEELRDRAISSMASMKSSRAVDKLYKLVEAGVLDEGDPKKWKDLRNPTAHGSLHIDPAKLQELLDNVYGSITLIYKLVFMQIGYVGKYTDFSRHGWRPRDFDSSACWAALNKVAAVMPPVGDSAPSETNRSCN